MQDNSPPKNSTPAVDVLPPGGPPHEQAIRLIQSGRPREALDILERTLEQGDGSSHIHNTLGVAFQKLGRHEEAITHFRKASTIDPRSVGPILNLGRALLDRGRFAEALPCFVSLGPPVPHIALDIARCHYEMGNFRQAASMLENVLQKFPHHVEVLLALGGASWAGGDRSLARKSFERALELEPENAKAALNFGEFLYDEREIERALSQFDRALTLQPGYGAALWRKSFALLAKGDYRDGWTLYAACLGDQQTRGRNIVAPKKPWDGRAAPEKRLMIWCEQGLGDTLQFIRYARLCKARMGKVVVFCQKPLVRLFQSLPFVDHASDQCDINSFDEHVPLLNLPSLFETTLETIPADIPYLHVNPDIGAKWAARFMEPTTKRKIGLVWAGGIHHGRPHQKILYSQRSMSLAALWQWLDVPDAVFYSLQKDQSAADEIVGLGLQDRIIDYMGEVADFADTAAIIQNLDLVITVDTSVAHLAGGLGKPVWVMSRFNSDWRWLGNRQNNPWYPSARVLGQEHLGDWQPVLDQIDHALRIPK